MINLFVEMFIFGHMRDASFHLAEFRLIFSVCLFVRMRAGTFPEHLSYFGLEKKTTLDNI